ncbi:hypothetical protein LTR17_000065 [Elasticomyces elasticus]|nr:hypothetical protein LTR17_000065 [Elasticomyces elasticus]
MTIQLEMDQIIGDRAALITSTPFNIPENVVAATERSYYPTAAQLYLRDVKREEIDAASPCKSEEYIAYQHERKERAVYYLEAKQGFLDETCATLGVSEDQLSYDSLVSALLQAKAQVQ